MFPLLRCGTDASRLSCFQSAAQNSANTKLAPLLASFTSNKYAKGSKMQCYTELIPPTAVTHSIYLPFTSSKSHNLVVAKSSLLQVFATKTIAAELDPASPNTADPISSTNYALHTNDKDGLEASFLGGDIPLVKMDKSNNTKLVLVAECPLAGTVTGLARIKVRKTKSGGEMLLVALKDAKMSLAQWDPVSYSVITISVHYYEQEELMAAPWAAPLGSSENFLVSDPGSRCAAFKFGTRNLAILPFNMADEDVEMDGWDVELDGPRPQDAAASNGISIGSIEDAPPYSSSFVLRLPNLDHTLIYPIHLAFLYEYREPTFGFLSSTMAPSNQLGRKDHYSYMVFTLDLNQKASTTILSVGNLPQDLFQVIPLPAPIGGALLVGTNELIHIDQSGKAKGVAVNEFAKQSTAFSLHDQSSLNLKLERCRIEILAAENAEMLMVLHDGSLAVIKFQIDGRKVSGLEVYMVEPEAGGLVIKSGVSSLSKMGRNTMFVGSSRSDSMVIGWTRNQSETSKKKSRGIDLGLDLDEEDEYDLDEDDFDDDLYAEGPTPVQLSADAGSSKAGDLMFKTHDKLLSIAPIRDITTGMPSFFQDGEDEKNSRGVSSEVQLVCAVGRGRAGAIVTIRKDVNPRVVGRFDFPEARGFWTLSVRKPVPKALQGEKGAPAVGGDYDSSLQYDRFMIVSKVDLDGYHTSDVYALTAGGFEALTETEFEPAAGFTVEAGTMGNEHRIVQVLKSEVRCYDGDLGLAQILPLQDEDSSADPRAVTASIQDPFLLVVRDDSSVYVASVDKYNDFEGLDRPEEIVNTKWISGCLYKDNSGVFIPDAPADKNIVMFLLSKDGDLSMHTLPDFGHVWTRSDVCYVPPVLGGDYLVRRGQAKEKLTEVLVADIGDATAKSPYLIVRNASDDLTLYQPSRVTRQGKLGIEFQKINNPALARAPEPRPKSDDDDDTGETPQFLPLRKCGNIGGYSSVFLPGPSPSFIMKSAKSLPKVITLRSRHVRGMSSFHTEGCENGFITVDNLGTARVCQLPPKASFTELGVAVTKIPMGEEVANIIYHPPTATYMTSCTTWQDFELPKDDDYHKEWQREQSLPLPPKVERSTLKLISSITWSEIQSIQLEPCEVVLCMETLNLEVSEETHERRQLLCVGTAVSRGEDLPIRGRIYVYDVVNVIPQPGRPETNRGLKLVAQEDVPRGAVTALSEIGTQGLMLVAQGQKCMVRGLKEDGTLLPVAFIDMSCYVTAAKELRGTGLCVLSDAFKGVWFTGYSEEPYRMHLFGKSSTRLEVATADFLPHGKELIIVAADYESGVHVLQYDPEHPKSLQGHLLLHLTTFAVGAHMPSQMLRLPAAPSPTIDPTSGSSHHHSSSSVLLMASSHTGMLSLLTPLSESSYLRLSSLTAQLLNNLTHGLGTNPKAYRMPGSTGAGGPPPAVDAGVGRSVVDGVLLGRWNELGSGRRAEMAGRAGFSGVDDVKGVLGGVVGWGGVGFF
ncbi:hypothetical protein MKZ38_008236 [Zalerion maritima]|uniref:Uncharacterized protein n=1 Tax=Zalerion maritima TaxID=339359 RepID=A0AAD5WNQ5_9PEZI|nr:hypothetical protein MKZ38_008236 [Zalerion maritima]